MNSNLSAIFRNTLSPNLKERQQGKNNKINNISINLSYF